MFLERGTVIMAEYRVKYEIDVDANTPLLAAKEAYDCMVDPASMLPILEVTAAVGGITVLIDLNKSWNEINE